MFEMTLAAGVLLILAPLSASTSSGGTQPARWTLPGWYLIEERQDGSTDLIRAGPLRDQAHCTTVRRGDYPPAVARHPELETLHCRELLKAPSNASR